VFVAPSTACDKKREKEGEGKGEEIGNHCKVRIKILMSD
jgi:hypothetical protein